MKNLLNNDTFLSIVSFVTVVTFCILIVCAVSNSNYNLYAQ